jgi:hypothetical protein
MAANYTFAELADMHLCYGRAHGNACEACHLYDEQFPRCLIPDASMFTSIYKNLRERDSFVPATHDQGRLRTVHTPDLEVKILTHVANNPATNMRRITSVEGVPQSIV